MKDLRAAKKIFGMKIVRDRVRGTLRLTLAEYVKEVLSKFNTDKAKPVGTPLGSHFRLNKDQSPKSIEEHDYMSKVPYALDIGLLMYAIVCTRLDIAHAVGVVSRYMCNPGKKKLGSSEVDSEVLKRLLKNMLVFLRRWLRGAVLC